ncbi:MAG TPA: protein-glutamate O-methyltransferase CheR [Roseomonas sp.]|jgi:chemotaxis protein methyltransferase CheR
MSAAPTLQAATFDFIAGLARSRAGIVLTPDKAYMIETRLSPLLRRLELRNLEELVSRLRSPREDRLIQAVVEALTTNESFFFRDGKPFEHLRRFLPTMRSARGPGARLRLWSAACSSGQEAYSIAMILQELGLQGAADILGTDISMEMVERARSGTFSQFEVQRGLPVQLLVKHFRQLEGGRWQIAEALRAAAEFRFWNLLDDPRSLGRFDAIFCRNVLIYFDTETKTQVLERLAKLLQPGGVVYLGGAETVLGLTTRLVPVPGERGVYSAA